VTSEGSGGVRTIGAVTVSRSDYGIYLPVFKAIQADPELQLRLYVGGMHLSPEFGLSVRQIEADGFEICERVEMLLSSDRPEGIAKSIGLGVIGFSQAYARSRPDLLLILGDRFEMLAAAIAALPFNIPMAHIHGGELTEGVIDDAIRHAMTKMSHLHFVSTEAYAKRVIQMGEEPWRVVVSGAPSLDNLRDIQLLTREALGKKYEIETKPPFLLITYHPVTLKYEGTKDQIEELLAALEKIEGTLVFTFPNADTSSRSIIEAIEGFVARTPRAKLFVNFGTRGYFSLMEHATAMVGNSSSGIIEAASFKLPVVNVGDRQRGRVRAENVIDVGNTHAEILAGIQKALSQDFRAAISEVVNPYGDGKAATRILDKLKGVKLDKDLINKRFIEGDSVSDG
jgi:UDP-hydrolysing UDP-N-acetyl-D-glucosamine 2-epimerase